MANPKRLKLAHSFSLPQLAHSFPFGLPQLVYRVESPPRISDYIPHKGTESQATDNTPNHKGAAKSRILLLRRYLITILFLISIIIPGLTLFFPRFATHFYLRLAYTALLSLLVLIVSHFTHTPVHCLHAPSGLEYACPF
jgi:hypothetical protein